MANFDTITKRYSGIGLDLPWNAMLWPPVTVVSRQHALRKYAGIFFQTQSGYGLDDLTTVVAFHLATLLPGEQTADLQGSITTARQNTGEEDNNTALWVDLNF